MITEPPFEVGSVKLIVAVPALFVIVVIVGAEGVVAEAAPYPVPVVILSISKPPPPTFCLNSKRVKAILGLSNCKLI